MLSFCMRGNGGDYLDLELIYDRTEEDVVRGNDKGVYRHTDLHRVQEAAAFLRERFAGAGYDRIPEPDPAFARWEENDIPRRGRVAGILLAVRAFAGLVPLADAPGLAGSVPSSPDRLDWRGANAIEEFLALLDGTMDRIGASWTECGEVFAGEAEA